MRRSSTLPGRAAGEGTTRFVQKYTVTAQRGAQGEYPRRGQARHPDQGHDHALRAVRRCRARPDSERTREGLARAKSSGRKLGGPKGLAECLTARRQGGQNPTVSRPGRVQDRHRQSRACPVPLWGLGSNGTESTVEDSIQVRRSSRDTVAGWTPNRRAASAAVFFPCLTSVTISCCWWGLSFGGRPPIRPSLRAASRPALVRSWSIARYHPTRGRGGVHRFLEAAKACVALLHPLHDGQYIRRERDRRSSVQTTNTSPFRS